MLTDIFALSGVQVGNYLFPLITLPYLTRVLGPERWGLLSMVYSLSIYLSMLVEYGYNLSATREVAQHRENPAHLGQLLAGVTGAKALLSVFAVIIGIGAYAAIPNLHGSTMLLTAGVFWAVAWGFNPLWFFQGLERLRFVAMLEVLSKVAALALIFLWVKAPDDAWKVLFFQGLAAMLVTGTAMVAAWREVGVVLPGYGQIISALAQGSNLFIFRAAVSIYTVGNVFILGLFVSPIQVAYYSGAERLTKALLGMLEPINRTLLPRISHLLRTNPSHAARTARTSVAIMVSLGFIFYAMLSLLAPSLVEILLGPGYEPATDLIRIMGVLLPVIAFNLALGLQWMVPLGLDKVFNIITVSGGLLNLAVAFVIVPRWAETGMAYVVVFTESTIAFLLFSTLYYLGKLPWRTAREG